MRQLPPPYEHYSISLDGKTVHRQSKVVTQYPNRVGDMMITTRTLDGVKKVVLVKSIQALAHGLIPTLESTKRIRIKFKDSNKHNLQYNNLYTKVMTPNLNNKLSQERKLARLEAKKLPNDGVIRINANKYVVLANKYIGTYKTEQEAIDSLETYNKYHITLDRILHKEINNATIRNKRDKRTKREVAQRTK